MKKLTKKLMSAFLALAMVLSLGSVTAFAAENTDYECTEVTMVEEKTTDQQAVTLSDYVINEPDWKFKQQRDSDLRDPAGRFYATAGQSVTITMKGIHSDSSQGFNIKVCRIVNGTPQTVSGPIHMNANESVTQSVVFGIYTTGTYIIRMERTNDGVQQCIDNVSIVLGG